MTDLFEQTKPLASGMLPEDGGHEVFWETFGNPDGPAILLLHGGPGGGVRPRMPRLFDPQEWYIIAMDQRGCGRSLPNAGNTVAALENNTTDHLIADIERLRQKLKIGKWTIYGASWGTTLAQAYGQAYRSHVEGLILASVTSTSRFEIDFLYGTAGEFLPEAFEAFCEAVPDAHTGVDRAAAYFDLLTSGDAVLEARAAKSWCDWEEAVMMADPRAEAKGRFADPRFALCFARLVTHYFKELAWLETPLLDIADRLSGIPVTLINSRVDLSCPLSTAWHLHQAIPNSKLSVVNGSLHGTLSGPLADEVIATGKRHSITQIGAAD